MDELGMLGVLTGKQQNYFLRINTLYDQQLEMHNLKKHSVDNRIVSLHQPHVRPIVRGKRGAKVEFGAKIQVGLVDGISYLDYLSWDAYNEGQYLEYSVEEYKRRTGYYPSELLADKIYCTRANRAFLKQKGIRQYGKKAIHNIVEILKCEKLTSLFMKTNFLMLNNYKSIIQPIVSFLLTKCDFSLHFLD